MSSQCNVSVMNSISNSHQVPSSLPPDADSRRSIVPHSRIPIRINAKSSNTYDKAPPVPTTTACVSPFLPVNLFSVPAILSHISQIDPDYILTFLHNDTRQQAVLQQTFLTALEKDSDKITWEEAKNYLTLGCQVKVDVTQVKPEENWLVFGLYLNSHSTSQEKNFTKVTSVKKQGFLSSSSDWMENIGESKSVTAGSQSSSKESFKSCSDGEYPCDDLMSDDSVEGNPLSSSPVFNQTFTLDEEPSVRQIVKSECVHKYEVGVVVVSISSQYLHMIGQLGDSWTRVDVDPFISSVFVEGIRIKEVFSVKMGAMGNMVVDACIKCQLGTSAELALTSPVLLWFGEEQSPCVRECPGVVVGREGDRIVVQLETEGSVRLVLFHGESIQRKLELQSKVLAWAWAKHLRGGAGSFLEGAALVMREEQDGLGGDKRLNDTVSDCDNTDLLELSTEGIFSPIRTKVSEEDSYFEPKDEMDASLSVSFGSMSGSEDVKEDFSMFVNPDMSTNHMEEISFSKDIENLETDIRNEIYFQSLFWRTSCSSPKPDAVIDAQFETVLAANEILNNYDDLVTDYDLLVSDSSFHQGMIRHSTVPHLAFDVTNGQDIVRRSVFFEDLVLSAPVGIDQSLVRKLSYPPLSPIPEETTEFCVVGDVEDAVFAAPSLASTPAGRLPIVDNSHSTPESVNGDFNPSKMDSGYYESFYSGSKPIESEAKSKLVRDVLEQFLEFSQFPCSGRAQVINNFITNSYKETM